MNLFVFIVFSFPLAAYARGTGHASAIDGLLMLIIFGFFAYSIVKDSRRKKFVTSSILITTFFLLFFNVISPLIGGFLIIAAPFIGFAAEPKRFNSNSFSTTNPNVATSNVDSKNLASKSITFSDESIVTYDSSSQKNVPSSLPDKPKLEFTTYLVNGVPHTYVDGKLKRVDN